ncbi:MAG TPA: SDR family oxidoreductase [Casimicrobiaceae bacterium]|nr:SDR family oxidoreductase [Casimicrobiaceae bacterium]
MNESTKSAIVTGGGSGIGRAVALALARAGYRVALAGRREAPLHDVVRAAGERSASLLPITTDVTDETSVARLFDTVRERFGRLDLLFNNAGTGSPPVGLEDLPVATLRAVIDTNLLGAFFCTQHAIRLMKAQTPRGGRIINNGSISAHAPRPRSAAYTATKHAITGLTKSISLDGRPYDIACGQIDIGNAATAMTDRMAEGVAQADGTVRPEPRMDVGDVARAVLYRASLPLDANVASMTVMATQMPFVGRG